MKCPKCGNEMQVRQSGKSGTLYQLCGRWPNCKIAGTPETMNLFEHCREERDRLMAQLEEARHGLVSLADKYADARAVMYGAEPTNVSLPVRLGDVLPSREWFEKRVKQGSGKEGSK